MKKLLFAMAVALLTFVSCSNEELVKEVPNQYGRITATIEQGATDSRLAIDQNNTLSWTNGDKIRIFMVNEDTYDYEYNATSEKFEPVDNVIPANTTDNDALVIVLMNSTKYAGSCYLYNPVDGDYGDGSVEGNTLYSGFQQNTVLASGAENRIILPMWGTWNNGSISFKHLAAVLRVNLTDLPEEYDLLAIITDQPISGNAYVENVTVENAEMKMDDDYTADGEHNLITIQFENAATRTLYVPLPVNTYGSIQVIVAKGEEDEGQFVDPIYLANYTNKIVQRAYIYNASPSYTANNAMTPSAVTNALSTTSTQQSVALTATIDATTNGAGSINIPTTLENLNLDFEQKPTTRQDAPLKIKSNTDAAVGDATQGLNIGMPEDADNIYMDIDYFREIWNKYANTLTLEDRKRAVSALESYEEIRINADNIDNVAKVQEAIEALGYAAYSEMQYLEPLKETSNMLQLVLGAIGSIAMMVSAINIANTMVMSIYERTKEIGVMKVLGCLVKDIKRQFLLEAGLIGLAGGLVGILISYVLSFLINKYGAGIMSSLVGMGTAGDLSVIPFWLPFAAAAFGMLVGLLSGYFPARRATRIRAIEAMKTEG